MMLKIAAWNIRGLNKASNQKQVMDLIKDHELSVCSLVETHVQKKNMDRVFGRVFGRWKWISNAISCLGYTRIVVGWDSNVVNVMVIDHSSQVVLCHVSPVDGKQSFFCSFVYGHVRMVGRRYLWSELLKQKVVVKDRPWCIMGDFNVIFDPGERSSGSSGISAAMAEFKECIADLEVDDLNMSGFKYTWNKTPGRAGGVLKKLDRVMGNLGFMSGFPAAKSVFLPFLLSDHTPAVLVIHEMVKAKHKSFKFCNYLVSKQDFLPIIQENWSKDVRGYKMFSVVSRLKLLKRPLSRLHFQQGNLSQKVVELKDMLASIQQQMVDDPQNVELRNMESSCLKSYNEALVDEELFLKQKAKVEWLKEGDKNSTYFHKVVNGNTNRRRIESIVDSDGQVYYGQQIGSKFADYFKGVLGSSKKVQKLTNVSSLFHRKLSKKDADDMVVKITNEEVKKALFDIGDNKAAGPDGFSAKFFKASWAVVGNDICAAVQEFFENGKLLKELNATIIALVPKGLNAQQVSEFRPISCCNVLYKCISKILVNRLQGHLSKIVDLNQSAFIPKRQISDNILLTQELMRGYHRDRGESRVAFKVDIQKAYDSVEWSFLRDCLINFGFHQCMVHWIMECISFPSFCVAVNGDLHGYFEGKRGLRQGDPLSPYLFTLVMEVFNLITQRKVAENGDFVYHWLCMDMKITHLCFADDLIMFAHGDVPSVRCLKEALDEFSDVSGLYPNLSKSMTFFGNVPEGVQSEINAMLKFKVGSLPIKYLGVPLISSRLYHKDCEVLIDKVKKKIMDWKNKSLSFAGRLQLISSVLNSLQVYWASVFILPKSVSKEIGKLLRGFLWNQGDLQRGKAKVKWADLCAPKWQGGLGIRDLYTWNVALITKHIWNIVTRKESLWVKWINTHKLKGRSFWEIPIKDGANCWSWRKLLQCRQLVREFMVSKLGDGKNTSAWFDMWHELSPLGDFITNRELYEARVCRSAKVADFVVNGGWNWPAEWVSLFPGLVNSEVPSLIEGKQDRLGWKSKENKFVPFCSKVVFNDLSESKEEVSWCKLVWYSQCIPRFSFILWLAIRRKLKTQDIIGKWETVKKDNLKCVFCQSQVDSHEHLFFECSYPKKVWQKVKPKAKLFHCPDTWNGVLDYFGNIPSNKSIWSVIRRLVLGAAVYYIWQERNMRTFQDKQRPVEELVKIICENIRLKLMGLKMRRSIFTIEASVIWGCQLDEIHSYDAAWFENA